MNDNAKVCFVHQVGRALAVSVLDLTNSNPCSRIPNSDYRSVNGIREWLRSNCMSDNQVWSRMLHRPTRQTQAQAQQQQLQVDNVEKIGPFPSPNEIAPTKDTSAEVPLNWQSVGREPVVCVESIRSDETVSSLNNCDRSYNRAKAVEYEKELQQERQQILERLRSERLKSSEGAEHEKKCELKALLEEELEKKREIVRKIREHEKALREKLNRYFPKPPLKPKDPEGRPTEPEDKIAEDEMIVTEMAETTIALQGEINDLVEAMAKVDEIDCHRVDECFKKEIESDEGVPEKRGEEKIKIETVRRCKDFVKYAGKKGAARWRNILDDIPRGSRSDLSSRKSLQRSTKRTECEPKEEAPCRHYDLVDQPLMRNFSTSTSALWTQSSSGVDKLSSNQKYKIREVASRRPVLTPNVTLTYSNQTDCDMASVILQELFRRENSSSRARHDDLFAVVVNNENEQAGVRTERL